jgi:hypothetical protein
MKYAGTKKYIQNRSCLFSFCKYLIISFSRNHNIFLSLRTHSRCALQHGACNFLSRYVCSSSLPPPPSLIVYYPLLPTPRSTHSLSKYYSPNKAASYLSHKALAIHLNWRAHHSFSVLSSLPSFIPALQIQISICAWQLLPWQAPLSWSLWLELPSLR